MLAVDLTPNQLRMIVREVMDKRRWSIDYVADAMGVPVISLRRWMHDAAPETNRQRYEWHQTHTAVTVFLSSYEPEEGM